MRMIYCLYSIVFEHFRREGACWYSVIKIVLFKVRNTFSMDYLSVRSGEFAPKLTGSDLRVGACGPH